MFDKIVPSSSDFEALKQFCFRIGEGRLEPQKAEIHWMNLYHPIVPEALLIVHLDVVWSTFYIREAAEGHGGHLDDLPLVHSFVDPKYRPIFPAIVEYLDATKMRYHYCLDEETCTFEDVPREQYLRLEMLFDEKNPFPWEMK